MYKYLVFSFVFIVLSCNTNKNIISSKKVAPRIAFYNVENLFDLEDNPATPGDDEFLPTGKKVWTQERYDKKINDLASVIAGMNHPAFVGLCEVESRSVLEDLVKNQQLKSVNYQVVHRESPDFRGIDNAFLFAKDYFKTLKVEAIRINFPAEIVEDYTTRDILHIKGTHRNNQVMHFFINHWPSRRGGLEASEPKRGYVAQQLKQAIDNILQTDPQAEIVIMGDFNDETNNKSVANILDAQPNAKNPQADKLYNCFAKLDAAGNGTYNYRGNWNMLDQIIVSGSLLDDKGWKITNPNIFKPEWLIYNSEKYGATPSRTYGGPNYYGGYSDHFAIFVEME